MYSIMIVDDDQQLRRIFEKFLVKEGYVCQSVASGEEALKVVRRHKPDLIILDVKLPGISGLEAFKAVRELYPKLPAIIMTGYGTTETAIQATKLGAYDYILKPFEIPEILNLVEEALEAGRIMQSRIEIDGQPSVSSKEALVGQSRAMQEIYKSIGRVASTDETVLIRGESGTGKELTARAIYHYSLRHDNPFLVINCVAIPENLLESELFGYEPGAFTGAAKRKIGKIEQADGGTVFLDEIGDMPISIQAKILRLLQERSIERLGGSRNIPVDVRIIAATNRNLEAAIAKGHFREDLYYRLKVVSINLPPLKRRKGDIPILCEFFLNRFTQELGIENPGIAEEALDLAEEYSWPGNVRELANSLKNALIFSKGYPVRPEDLIPSFSGMHSSNGSSDVHQTFIRHWLRQFLMDETRNDNFTSLLDEFACLIIKESLDISKGNRSKAARLLGISRTTLHKRLLKCGMDNGEEIPSEEFDS